MNIRRVHSVSIILSILFILGISLVSATTITGTAYDLELTNLNTTIFELSNPVSGETQKFVSKDSTYSFEVTDGTYQLVATHNTLVSVDTIIVSGETDIIHDIIILDDLSDLDELLTDTDEELVSDYDVLPPTIPLWIPLLGIMILIFLVAIAYALRQKSSDTHRHDPDTGNPPMESSEKNLDDLEIDLKRDVLSFIDQQQGRTTQKLIRKQFSYSEAKISLVLSELEHDGIIKKIKKGRSNIIIRNNN